MQHYFKAASTAHDAGKAEGTEYQQGGAHDFGHATAVQQLHDLRSCGSRIKAGAHDHRNLKALDGSHQQALQGDVLENQGFNACQNGGAHHNGQGGLFHNGASQNHDNRQQQENIKIIHGFQLLQHGAYSLGGNILATAVLEANYGINHQGNNGSRNGSPEHMANVLIQLGASSNGSQVGSIGQGRNLVAKIRASDDCTSSSGQIYAQGAGDTHQSNTHGSYGAPGGAGYHGYHSSNQKCGYQHEGGINDLHAIINHHGDGASAHPSTNQSTYAGQDQNCRHALSNLLADFVHHFIPGYTHTESDDSRNTSYQKQ